MVHAGHTPILNIMLGLTTRFSTGVFLVAAVSCVWSQGLATPGKEQTAARLKFVEKLIEHSSAARQVKASTNPDAKARHAQARVLYAKAVSAYHSEDYTNAADLLNQALRTMFAAVRMADRDKVLAEKRERDFQNRLGSVNALTDAHNRVSEEKGAGAANSELRQWVDRKVAQAHRLREAGKPVEGRSALDEAYVAIKVAIEALRGGDTLVRALNFATKQEEYQYEVNRNDTHRMLVDVLLREKMEGSDAIKTMVQRFIDNAAGTRNKAEELAGKGEYDEAVKTMEQSTKDILRAIRSAGIYIPG